MKKVILIEFNELCPALLDKWMAEGHLPNFKRLYDRSEIFISEADESDPGNLEPWIQWYSVHTGLPYSKHGVFYLTDGPKAGHPDIWSMLQAHGLRVWNCSSMNAAGFAREGSAFLPDPWCTTEQASPDDLGIFHRFVSHHVQEYSNNEAALSTSDTLKFLYFMATHGLRGKTISAIVNQIPVRTPLV